MNHGLNKNFKHGATKKQQNVHKKKCSIHFFSQPSYLPWPCHSSRVPHAAWCWCGGRLCSWSSRWPLSWCHTSEQTHGGSPKSENITKPWHILEKKTWGMSNFVVNLMFESFFWETANKYVAMFTHVPKQARNRIFYPEKGGHFVQQKHGTYNISYYIIVHETHGKNKNTVFLTKTLGIHHESHVHLSVPGMINDLFMTQPLEGSLIKKTFVSSLGKVNIWCYLSCIIKQTVFFVK